MGEKTQSLEFQVKTQYINIIKLEKKALKAFFED